MVALADSSFLTALYLNEPDSLVAHTTLGGITPSPYIAEVTLLEVRNAINAAYGRQRISAQERTLAFQLFHRHLNEGQYQEAFIPSVLLYAKACELSDRLTPIFLTRSLDLLHIATALIVRCDTFLSFDKRQKEAARAEGMTVLP